MEILAKLFGSVARVKIMKLFLLNPEQVFDNVEISSRTKIVVTSSRKELNLLSKIKFIKKKSFFKEVGDRSKTGKKRKDGWILNKDFSFFVSQHTNVYCTLNFPFFLFHNCNLQFYFYSTLN